MTYHQGFCRFRQQHDFFCAININGQCQFEFFIKANGGGGMEDNFNVFNELSAIGLGNAKTRQTAITFNGHNLVAEFFFFILLLQL